MVKHKNLKLSFNTGLIWYSFYVQKTPSTHWESFFLVKRSQEPITWLLTFCFFSQLCCGLDATNSEPAFWNGSASNNKEDLVTMVTKQRLKAVPGDARSIIAGIHTELFRPTVTYTLAVNLPANMNNLALGAIILIALPYGKYWVNTNRLALHIFWLWWLKVKLAVINFWSSDLRPFLRTDRAVY